MLSLLLQTAMEGGFMKGCLISGQSSSSVRVSHFLFAVDNIVFCEAKEEQLLYLSWILFGLRLPRG